tara:strand:+ start:213 stop:1304 length:1092 start_codon:yes stop_codon:yes gene_type:complete
MKIINVVGTRPNFMKIAPIVREINKFPEIKQILVHTGQHYDTKMSSNFFDELEIPKPDIHLEIGSHSHTIQTAKIMTVFEEVCDNHSPDFVLVVGDVNSTMACSIVAAKKGIKLIHVEAGIRSGDRTMPEEINRLVTDAISNYLLPPSIDAVQNLIKEGHSKEKIKLVGNVMIDSLMHSREKINKSKILKQLGLIKGQFVILTMHRPSNTDNKKILEELLDAFNHIQKKTPIIFPIHPRTRKMIQQFNLTPLIERMKNLILIDPLGYFDFGKLVASAKFAITDSGGVQEETTVYGVPCITIRKNTERPITITEGTNILVGNNSKKIISATEKIMDGKWKKGKVPELWDGKTAERIVSFLRNIN